MGEKLKLYGFNNLTKALSFNIYDVCYAKTPREQRDYIAYIDEQYNSERLTNILTTLTEKIGAKVLNIARQDYDPQGASVTILIAEGSMVPAGETQLAHLDKSHVTVHTYPEYHPETCLATFRVLYRPRHPAPLRRGGHQRVRGQPVPHQDDGEGH